MGRGDDVENGRGWTHGDNAKDGWERRRHTEDVGFRTDTLGAHRCNIGDVLMKHARISIETCFQSNISFCLGERRLIGTQELNDGAWSSPATRSSAMRRRRRRTSHMELGNGAQSAGWGERDDTEDGWGRRRRDAEGGMGHVDDVEDRMDRFPLLDPRFDEHHRARRIENGEVLNVLRPMTHEASTTMVYDERYTPLLKVANLATVARVCRRGTPPFNPAALTALIDRWRPETHSFHLPCGEMTVTLEDIAMILGVKIRGFPVTGDTESEGWQQRVEHFLGRPLAAVEAGKKRRSSGVSLRWLRQQFRECPPNVDAETVTYYCRAYVLHMLGTVLFPDGTGDTASWMYIPCLLNWEDAGNRSWGSAILAFLYRQLCEACRHPGGSHATMSGCITLLQIWMWERLPVGRPHQLDPPQPWFPQGDAVVAPTVAHLYERAHGTYHVSRHAYISFTNELDTLLPQHVQWSPYRRRQVTDLNLSALCMADEDVWTMRTPLICFYAVEYHLPHRVARRFGRLQPSLPDDFSTGWQLHKYVTYNILFVSHERIIE
ncbi:protein MAIN-LIKE 1-like [Miscanthus floridulus]|uniref:protein MAIN-LIKE 1-like n=1 Tax=Miscanthus floridulus TaxID=154761 RepID=UPI00345A4FF3